MSEIIESVRLKSKGARWYVTSDYGNASGRLSLSKASLGLFTYEILKRGAQLGQLWALSPKYERSFVQASVFMTPEMKEAFERDTKFRFSDPPKVHLNAST